MFHAGPKAYGILRQVFCLPTVRTLRKSLQNIHIYPGFSAELLDAFRVKVQGMSSQDKLCAVVFEEMGIKEHVYYNPERDLVEGYEDYGMMGRLWLTTPSSSWCVVSSRSGSSQSVL